MPAPKHSKPLVRTVRLDDKGIAEILARLDAADDEKATDGRGAERHAYRVQGCVVHMQQPGATSASGYLVPTRNISATGMAFLHGGFVHVGTKCLVQLITSNGVWQDVQAEVVRCRYIQGSLHEVGLKFDRPIDASEFSPAARKYAALLADDDPLIARLVTFHLNQMNVCVDHVPDGRQAVDRALAGGYDVVFLDIEMPTLDGPSAAAELRGRGYTGLIVALTAHTTPGDKERCLHAGCDRFIPKPFQREHLVALVASLRDTPLVSAYHHDPAMAPLIEEFIAALPGHLRAMEEALAKEDLAALETQVRRLKAEGSGYGFEPISTKASKIETALIGHAAFAQVKDDVDELVKLCLLARRGYNQGGEKKSDAQPPTMGPADPAAPPAATPPSTAG